MKHARTLAAAAAAIALCAPLVCADTAQAAPAVTDGCTASASLGLPGNVLVLSQEDTERHPVLTTSCPLAAVSVTILSSTNEQADFIDWSQNPAHTGDTANWDEYAFTYTAGHTYHTDQSSYGLYSDPDGNLDQITVTTAPFAVKDATRSDLISASRSGGVVTLKGVTEQYAPADFAWAHHEGSLAIEQQHGAKWPVVAWARSNASGDFSTTLRAAATYSYRLVVPTTGTLEASTSNVKRV